MQILNVAVIMSKQVHSRAEKTGLCVFESENLSLFPLVAGPAPEGERPSVTAAALQSHVSDRPQTQTPHHPACSQAGGLIRLLSPSSLPSLS